MTKGPSPARPRPERPVIKPTDIPWTAQGVGGAIDPDPCAQSIELDVDPLEPLGSSTDVAAVALGGAVRLVAEGRVLAVLPDAVGSRLTECMAMGWRYPGHLIPLRPGRGHVIIEGRKIQ